jgi:uncharacterized protein (DUF2235 family)
MATGLGITNNIIDCYAAITKLYEDGDRIFLIGFTRAEFKVTSLSYSLIQCYGMSIPTLHPHLGHQVADCRRM